MTVQGAEVGGFEQAEEEGVVGEALEGERVNSYRFSVAYFYLEGALAVAQRNGAVLNDNAVETLRKPITVEDYLASRIVSTPLRLLDSVMPAAA